MGGDKTNYSADAAVTGTEEGLMIWVWLWYPLKCIDDVLPGWA
jgi:hypothetical protein